MTVGTAELGLCVCQIWHLLLHLLASTHQNTSETPRHRKRVIARASHSFTMCRKEQTSNPLVLRFRYYGDLCSCVNVKLSIPHCAVGTISTSCSQYPQGIRLGRLGEPFNSPDFDAMKDTQLSPLKYKT